MLGVGDPFVLLDRGDHALLYRDPVDEIVVYRREDVAAALTSLDAALTRGYHCSGYLTYEAGLALEPRLACLPCPPRPDTAPLLWFGLFAQREEIPAAALAVRHAAAWSGTAEPLISRDTYGKRFAQAQRFIRAGDVYQINLTFPCRVPVRGHPFDLYSLLRSRARARHGGIVRRSGQWMLSFSPELFFELEESKITCRPMKGTAPRDPHPGVDGEIARRLASDPKQRAENLMIVDLLRSDLSRIGEPGSVRVPRLFEVESYPTVHQLTSTVTARLRPDTTAPDLLRALFPCGSITGAPKIRAMEVIDRLESGVRGIYTGSVGTFAPDRSALFNVAIRTLTLADGDPWAGLGVGSGVVADSDEEAEWRECLQKAAFTDCNAEARFAS